MHGDPSSRTRQRQGMPARAPVLLALAVLGGLAAAGAPQGPGPTPGPAPTGQSTREFAVPPPPLTEGIFPCSECHKDIVTNPQRRVLTDAHDDIVLEHDTEHRWCLDCHSAENRDMLRLAGGQLVEFDRSYLLCGQCHGDKFRDWKVGVHGKRTGSWNGEMEYLLCVHCHNPHSPLFKPIAPLPPPVRPETLRPPRGSTR